MEIVVSKRLGDTWLHPKGSHYYDMVQSVCLQDDGFIRCWCSGIEKRAGDGRHFWKGSPSDELLLSLIKQEAWEQVWDRLIELEILY